MPRALVPALLLSLAAAPAPAEVRLEARGERIDLSARAAPLTEVLDRLARQIGMKVVYEGPAPRQLVTVTLRDRTASEAVLSVLEGQGVNFALVWDETGVRLQTLMIAGAASMASAPTPPRPAPEPLRRPAAAPTAGNAPDPGFEPEQEESADEPPADTSAPAFGPPATETAPGAQAPPPAVQAPPQQFPVSPFAPQPLAAPQPPAQQPAAGQTTTGQTPPP